MPTSPLQRVVTRRPTAATCWRMLRLTRSMKAVLICQPQAAHTCCAASSVPNTTRWLTRTRRRRRTVLITCAYRPYRTDGAITPHLPYLIERQHFYALLCALVVPSMTWRYFPLLPAPVVFRVHRGKMVLPIGHFSGIMPVPNIKREIQGARSIPK